MPLYSFVFTFFAPYLCFIVLGAFLFLVVYKRKVFRVTWLNWTVAILCFIVPFTIYFACFPIYQNDLHVGMSSVSVKTSESELVGNGVLILAIPGCPYCMEALEYMKVVKEREPKFNVHMAVLGTSRPEDMQAYSEYSDDKVDVMLSTGNILRKELKLKRYPSYALVKDSVIVGYWSNQEFGVFALKEIQDQLGI